MSKPSIGPALPPGFGAQKTEASSIGPMPPGPSIGPMPPGPSIGPLPPGPSIGPIPPGPSIGPMPPGASIGPQPPPSTSIGPEMPTKSNIGPQMPPRVESRSESESEDSDEGLELHDEDALRETALYGPALPPGFGQKKVLGPTLPQGGIPQHQESDEEEDDFQIGPVLPGSTKDDAYWARSLEKRAQRMKEKLQPKEEKVERESWMTELPTNRSGLLGLEARQFRKNAAPERNADNSIWTDTPADKLKKQKGLIKEQKMDSKQELEELAMAKRDQEMAARAKAHKRDSKSLLERHEEKNKKAKGLGEGEERVMFDRDRDLQVNKFDDAQKKSIINKAKFLDDRFSSGNRKYL